MDSAVSVAQGVFVFKNGAKAESKRKKSKKTVEKINMSIYCDELWYKSYKSVWENLEKSLEDLNRNMFAEVLQKLLDFIGGCYSTCVNDIPSAALMTGINMPDHSAQFASLCREIRRGISRHVVVLNSQNCATPKTMVESLVYQFTRNENDDSDDASSDEDSTRVKIKKNQCTFLALKTWYENLYGNQTSQKSSPSKKNRPNLVVIIPDFESFNEVVLQNLILIVSSYINTLPIVLVFGVATSLSIIHKSFPYHVSSKMKIEVFHSQPSTAYLNNVLENVFLTPECPFLLGESTFNLLVDIFLFYDFSVKGFIQSFKFAMMEHYYGQNMFALCCHKADKRDVLNSLKSADLKAIQQLPSMKECSENFKNEDEFKDYIYSCLKSFHRYLLNFHLLLKCLNALVGDLPKSPLGKNVRQLYAVAVSKNIVETSAYKECIQLLSFQAKEEFTKKLEEVINVFQNNQSKKKSAAKILGILNRLLEDVVLADFEVSMVEECNEETSNAVENRAQWRQKLMEKSKAVKSLNNYEITRRKCLESLTSIFEKYLCHPASKALNEIFVFNGVTSIKRHVLGSHRAAIHAALTNPQYYLQCECCYLNNETALKSSLPDICIAYKLHMESGRMINMYDWLQAFATVIDPAGSHEDDDERSVNPKIQARFTRAVAEMEFLGFIKSSRRKTDHVTRLTWGGC